MNHKCILKIQIMDVRNNGRNQLKSQISLSCLTNKKNMIGELGCPCLAPCVALNKK